MKDKFDLSLRDDFEDFLFPFFDFGGYNKKARMLTDVKETEDGYELQMELPGVDKKDVHLDLEDGYLTI